MVINILSNNSYKDQDYKQDFYHYNYEEKKMEHYHGGRMILDYIRNPETGTSKLTPKIVDMKVKQYGNNWDDIKKWVEQNKAKFEDVELLANRSIQINLDDDDLNWFRKEMSKLSFHYNEEEDQ